MKNFPHQFNNLSKLFNALLVAKDLSDQNEVLSDDNFGTALTYAQIYTYRDKNLSIDQYITSEKAKPISNRGYLTVSRDIRRLFELLDFIHLNFDKSAIITKIASKLLNSTDEKDKNDIWRRSFLQLGLEGSDGELSHPYRILLKFVNENPGIETSKLLLTLEAENDSDEEYERIQSLSELSFEEIIEETATTLSMARNAVKILPGIAEQLGDIERIDNRAFPKNKAEISEDEIISTPSRKTRQYNRQQFWPSSANDIAKDPILSEIDNISIDLTDAVKLRQKRLQEHQDCVRLLASINENSGFNIFEGKFDCLAVKEQGSILYEIKTLAPNLIDEENQTVKAVGQLKFYSYFIIKNQMEINEVIEVLVFSRMPTKNLVDFCNSINIEVIWRKENEFKFINNSSEILTFNPNTFIGG